MVFYVDQNKHMLFIYYKQINWSPTFEKEYWPETCSPTWMFIAKAVYIKMWHAIVILAFQIKRFQVVAALPAVACLLL